MGWADLPGSLLNQRQQQQAEQAKLLLLLVVMQRQKGQGLPHKRSHQVTARRLRQLRGLKRCRSSCSSCRQSCLSLSTSR